VTATIITPATAPRASARHEQPARTAWRLAGVELRLLLREPMVAIGLLGFPLVTMLVIAGVFGQVPDPDFGGVAPDDYYIAGYLGVVLATLGVVTLPVFVATNTELGVTRRFRASGVTAGVLVTSRVLVGIALGLGVGAVVLGTGAAAYGMTAPEHLAATVGWFVAGLLCFIAVGLAIGSLAPSGRSAAALGNLILVPMFLLGGGGPPRQVMSEPMRAVSDALPLTHVVGGLRLAWLGQTDDPHQLWYPIVLAGVAVMIAVIAARRRVA
jgi:ABC-2 type transport system permease protein